MDETTTGILFAIGAILGWGSFGFPIKYWKVTDINPIIIQLYFSLSIFLSSWLILLYTEFHFTYLGVIGASMWVTSSIMSFLAIKFAGLAIAQGIWSGAVIIVSFLWGAIYFKEQITSIGAVTGGVILIIIGVSSLSTCNTQVQLKLPGPLRFLYNLRWIFIMPADWRDLESIPLLSEDESADQLKDYRYRYHSSSHLPKLEEEDDGSNIEHEVGEDPFSVYLFGVGALLAVILGILSGCIFVPMHFLPEVTLLLLIIFTKNDD
jgi:hypothetical protein